MDELKKMNLNPDSYISLKTTRNNSLYKIIFSPDTKFATIRKVGYLFQWKSLLNPKDTLCVVTVRDLAMPGAITSTAQSISSTDSHNPHTVNPVWLPNVSTVAMSIWQITVNAQSCWHPSGRKSKPSKIA